MTYRLTALRFNGISVVSGTLCSFSKQLVITVWLDSIYGPQNRSILYMRFISRLRKYINLGSPYLSFAYLASFFCRSITSVCHLRNFAFLVLRGLKNRQQRTGTWSEATELFVVLSCFLWAFRRRGNGIRFTLKGYRSLSDLVALFISPTHKQTLHVATCTNKSKNKKIQAKNLDAYMSIAAGLV